MSTISIKVENKEQAEKLEKLFSEVCENKAPEPMNYRPKDCVHFCVNIKEDSDWYWFSFKEEKKKTWREFVLSYLKNRYVVVGNSTEKLFVMDFFGVAGIRDKTKEQRARDLHYNTLYFNDADNFWAEWSKRYSEQKEISFSKVQLLLNSVEEFEQQRFMTAEKTINLTQKEAALLCACLTNKDRLNRLLREDGCCFMVDFAEKNKADLFCKIAKIADPLDEYTYVTDSKDLFKPQIKEMEFSCGLKTETKDRQITIGCQTKSTQEWLDYVDKIIELNLDKAVIDMYSFERSEIIRFRDWLKENNK